MMWQLAVFWCGSWQPDQEFPLLQLFRAGGGVFCVLELDDHGAAFEAAAGVILSPWNMNGGDVPAWNKQPAAGFVAFVVKEHSLT